MRKALIAFGSIICVFVLLVFCLHFNKAPQEVETPKENVYILDGLDELSDVSLITSGFEANDKVTVAQIFAVFSRMNNQNFETMQECKDFVFENGVYLPSEFIYNSSDWKKVWKDIVLGNTLFETSDDGRYSVSLIKGYLKIYLNEQGYLLVKKGLIPPHLYLYSPFSDIREFDEPILNREATQGLIFECLMCYDFARKNNFDTDTYLSNWKEEQCLNVQTHVENLTGKARSEWGSKEVSLYDYYSLGYYGVMTYAQKQGYLQDNVDLNDFSGSLSVGELLLIYDMVLRQGTVK